MANCLTCTNGKQGNRQNTAICTKHHITVYVSEHQCMSYAQVEEPKVSDWEDVNAKHTKV